MDIRRISIHPMLKTLLSGLKLKQIHTLQYFEKIQKINPINNAFLVDFHKQKPKLLHNDQNYIIILKHLKVTPSISKNKKKKSLEKKPLNKKSETVKIIIYIIILFLQDIFQVDLQTLDDPFKQTISDKFINLLPHTRECTHTDTERDLE
jgi:hypothetical protein